MADEETGFTFVDKRRTQADAPVESTAEALPEADSEEELHEDAMLGSQSPGTYDLLGYCLNLMASQAWQKLGLLADPQTGEAKPDLVEAKVAIDVVGDLAARLESAPLDLIPADMRRELRTLLNDLRLNYVSKRGDDAPEIA